MTARRDLLDGLRSADLFVDATNTVRRYTDGVVYILTEPTSLTERLTYTVIAAVNVGQDIDTYTDRVLTALAGLGPHFVALSQTTAYSDEPVPGRDMPPADLVRITVISDQLWH